MKRKNKPVLVFSTETVRRLCAKDLAHVGGGGCSGISTVTGATGNCAKTTA